MDDQGLIKRRGFWLLALLWLPAGVVATAAVRFAPEAWPGMWLWMALMWVCSARSSIALYATIISSVPIRAA